MHIAYHTRSRCLVETTSASSQSHIGSGKGSSQFPHTEEGGNPKGDELEDELMCDVDVDLVANDAFGPGPGTFRCSTRKPRFPPFQARTKA